MKTKVVVLGGGTGMSTLLRGLKEYPVDITAIVSVCDDGGSTGRLRKEFNNPAVGDLRKVITSLSETEPLFEKLMNYTFETTSDLNNHKVGNLLLTALSAIAGNMSDGIESISKVLNLKGKVLPLTEDNVTLVGKMEDDTLIEGEHNITLNEKKIKDVFYKTKPVVTSAALKAILEADLIILSIGSIYTSILPNLIIEEMIQSIDKSKANIMYVCNMMTQPGETDNFTASDHINLLNQHLGNRKIDTVIINSGEIPEEIAAKYETLEQKNPVKLDLEELEKLNIKIISEDFVSIENNIIRHNTKKLAFYIYSTVI